MFLGRRTVRIVVAVYGSTQGDFWDKAQDLVAAFSPTIAYNNDSDSLGFRGFDFYQPTADIVTWPVSAYPNGIPLRMYLRPFSVAGQPIDRDTDGGVASRGLAKKFTVTLVAKDPLKFSITGSSSTGSTYTTMGDSPVYPYLYISATTATGTWTGTLNGSSYTVNVDGSKFTAPQAAGSNLWLLDCGAGILYGPTTTGLASLATGEFPGVLPDGGTPRFLVRRMDRLDGSSAFPVLAVGANVRTVGGTLSPTQTAQWRDAFQ